MKTLSIRTFDSMTRLLSRDTLLAPATEAELAKYFAGRAKLDPGKVWDGFFKPMLDAMSEDARDELLGQMKSYEPFAASGEMGAGPASANRTNTSTTRTGDAMRKWRGQDHARIKLLQEANDKFWAHK